MKTIVICLIQSLLVISAFAAETIKIKLEPGEKIWSGVITDGDKMPLKTGFSFDFYANN